jgi:hypothetical protein
LVQIVLRVSVLGQCPDIESAGLAANREVARIMSRKQAGNKSLFIDERRYILHILLQLRGSAPASEEGVTHLMPCCWLVAIRHGRGWRVAGDIALQAP